MYVHTVFRCFRICRKQIYKYRQSKYQTRSQQSACIIAPKSRQISIDVFNIHTNICSESSPEAKNQPPGFWVTGRETAVAQGHSAPSKQKMSLRTLLVWSKCHSWKHRVFWPNIGMDKVHIAPSLHTVPHELAHAGRLSQHRLHILEANEESRQWKRR